MQATVNRWNYVKGWDSKDSLSKNLCEELCNCNGMGSDDAQAEKGDAFSFKRNMQMGASRLIARYAGAGAGAGMATSRSKSGIYRSERYPNVLYGRSGSRDLPDTQSFPNDAALRCADLSFRSEQPLDALSARSALGFDDSLE